jgi:transcriptional regulator with XRE-family HTH domain
MKQPELGAHITKLRIQNQLTQKDLADLIKVNIRTIQRIETGEVTPRLYTIKLLSQVLETNINADQAPLQDTNQTFVQQVRFSFIVGIIFSINYVPVMINILNSHDAARPFVNPFLYVLFTLIHIVTIIFFVKGFYLIGKRNNNQILQITSAAGMFLLPLLSILDLLNGRFFNTGAIFIIFYLACINAAASGVALLFEGYKRNQSVRSNLFTATGLITIIQSLLFLSSKFEIITTAVIMSVICNVLSVVILRREYTSTDRLYERRAVQPLLIRD